MTKLIDRARIRASTQSEREAKANEVENLASELLDIWRREVSGAKGVTFYMHAAYHHLPDMIRRLPCDILLASGDAFEAKNQQLKRILRRWVCFSIRSKTYSVLHICAEGQTSAQRPAMRPGKHAANLLHLARIKP